MVILFFLLWIILNGRFSYDIGMVEIAVTGAIISVLIWLFAYKVLGMTPKAELRMWRKLLFLGAYAFVLIWEMLKANIQILPIILHPKQRISPSIVKITVPLKSEFARVLLANSITLTPGTLTVEATENVFTVHCLDTSFTEGMESSAMVKLLERMER